MHPQRHPTPGPIAPPPPAPLLLRESPDHAPTATTSPDDDPTATNRGRKLLCRGCRALITTTDMRTRIHGKHEHVFANPAGYMYQIGCFATAPGCSHEGSPSWEFTWFQGHTWQIAVCRGCNALMGWRFRTPLGEGFHALVLTHLVEDEDE